MLKKHTVNPRTAIKKKKKKLQAGVGKPYPQAIWLTAYFYKQNFIGTQPYPLIYVLPMIAFALQQQN